MEFWRTRGQPTLDERMANHSFSLCSIIHCPRSHGPKISRTNQPVKVVLGRGAVHQVVLKMEYGLSVAKLSEGVPMFMGKPVSLRA